MRKSLIKSLFVTSLSFFIFQCHHETKELYPSVSDSYSSLEVSASRAQEIASSYIDLNSNAIMRKNMRTTGGERPGSDNRPKKVKVTRTIKDDEGVDLMHVIDYEGENKENRGFMIISADRRMTPILARGDTGSFHTENPGIQIWLG